MSDFLLSQILVGIAFCFDVASMQMRQKNHVLICLSIACVLMAAHFYLIDAHTAALAFMISALRFTTSVFTRSIKAMFLFMLLIVGATIYSYAGLLSLMIASSSLISTWAAFRASDRRFREVLMLCASILIVHNILAGTPAAVVLELFFVASNLLAYYRFYLRDK
jgi:hypothetical protein